MSLKALPYLGIRSDKLNDWSSFAGGLLGMQKIDKGGRSMARGISKGAAFFSNMTERTPYSANSKPAVSPVGPDPTMTTGTVSG